MSHDNKTRKIFSISHYNKTLIQHAKSIWFPLKTQRACYSLRAVLLFFSLILPNNQNSNTWDHQKQIQMHILTTASNRKHLIVSQMIKNMFRTIYHRI